MSDFAGKCAIVTGAADGPKAALGATFARTLAAAGASVLVVDRLDVEPTVASIKEGGGSAEGYRCDLAEPSAAIDAANAAVRHFGRVDILVNNAALGSNIPPVGMGDIPIELWDQMMAVNVRGTMLAVRAVAPIMARQGYGKIVNLGSPMRITGAAMRLHYAATKGAIHAMTRSMARELGGDGIRVNTLTPGLPGTAFNLERMSAEMEAGLLGGRSIHEHITASQIADVLLFLASPRSDAITGQELLVDNGGSFL
ncbi:SDR family NAD(P)-dependent oxidoreductase [Sphingomonas immobilis]|uniref:SDR family oxidoreductase n=1 Tax=Sphingomonas immobilis TaxID=3063997 RepID=A0ABT8ZTA3_9SPHN|nr:SDR family oxidoreductase [Sphingomonas sp. CA1-15]MDO7840793.1 SDR family oxidoreductase [Sphingomonas sp. CA1-15]